MIYGKRLPPNSHPGKEFRPVSELRQDDRPSGTVPHAFERLRSRAHTVATLVEVRDQVQSESELSTLQFAGLRGKRLPDFIWSS